MGREWFWSRRIAKEERERPGCMPGILHFLDLHHLLFTGGCRTPAGACSPTPEHHHDHHVSSLICKGVEAPRNSLELEDPGPAAAAAVREEYYGIPIGIQISLPAKKKTEPPAEEEKRSSQAVTPRSRSIVARLMGLEVLREDALLSPGAVGCKSISTEAEGKIGSNKKKKKLPENESGKVPALAPPRRPLQARNLNVSGSLSLPESPRVSSEVPRFSLQLNKENKCGKRTPDLVCHAEVYSGNLSLPLPASPRRKKGSGQKDETKSLQSSCSYREAKQMKDQNLSKREEHFAFNYSSKKKSSKAPLTARFSSVNLIKPRPKIEVKRVVKMEPRKCKKANYERLTERIKSQPSPTSVAGGQRTSMIGAFSHPEENRDLRKSWKNQTLFQYVKAIVDCSDVAGANPVKWFSPSLPIDPSVFHILELKLRSVHGDLGHLNHRWNRKLLFHLVEEILGDILLREPKRWRCNVGSDQLLSRLWSEIASFPSADCRVVGDIDSLVAGDLPEAKVRRLLRHPSVATEAEAIAGEIEWDILDSLVGDAAAVLALCRNRGEG